MCVHLHIVSDNFWAKMAELRSAIDAVCPTNPQIFIIWPFKKVFADL